MKIKKKEFSLQSLDPAVSYKEGIPNDAKMSDMQDAYSKHPWVYASVFTICTNFAQIDYKFYTKNKKGELVEVESTKNNFIKILEKPNPYMTSYDLKELTAASLELSGNSYWLIERDQKSKLPYEIYPLHPDTIKLVSSSAKMVEHYLYTINGNKKIIPFSDMIHFKYTNPKDYYYGQSSIAAAWNIIETDYYAELWNKYFFKNSARPDAILETDKTLDDSMVRRTLGAFKKLLSGSKKARGVVLLQGGLKYKPMEHNHTDMQFSELRKSAREQVLASHGVPPSTVGVLEYANYSNMEEQTKLLWTHTMLPKFRKFQATLTMRVQQISGMKDIIVLADLSNIEALKENEKSKAEIAQIYFNMGVPYNNLVQPFKLPVEQFEGGNVSYPRAIANNQTQPPAAAATGKMMKKSFSEDVDLDIYARSFHIEKIARKENFMASSMRAFFKSQRARVKKKFSEKADLLLTEFFGKSKSAKKSTIDLNIIFDLEQETDLLKKRTGPIIKSTFFDFAIEASESINPEFDFNLQDPRALAWIEAKTVKISREINAYTLETISQSVIDEIEEALAEGFEKSETIAQIADRIDDIYDFAVENRSERIARTEIISASNKGTLEGYMVTGVIEKKWLATNDDHKRDWHWDMNGDIVGIDEAWVTSKGNSLDYPGDSSAPPEEIVNCRCTLVAVKKD